jgi:hypothetical protein
MEESRFIEQAIKMFPLAEREAIFRREEAKDGVDGQSRVAHPEKELGSVAGGQDDDFVDALARRQLCERLVTPSLTDPEAFAHRHRRRPVVQTDYHEGGFQRLLPVDSLC